MKSRAGSVVRPGGIREQELVVDGGLEEISDNLVQRTQLCHLIKTSPKLVSWFKSCVVQSAQWHGGLAVFPHPPS